MTVVYGNSSGWMRLLAPQLDRVHVELVGRHVDDALDQRRRLGTPGAAVRAHRRGVGERRRPRRSRSSGCGRRPAPSCACEPIASVPPNPRVRAGVADHAAPHADDRAVALEPELDVLHLRRVRASSRPCSRSGTRPSAPAGSARARRAPRSTPPADQCLAPNDPPTCGAITPELVHVDAEVAGDEHPRHVRHLAREVHGDVVAERRRRRGRRRRAHPPSGRPRRAGSRTGRARSRRRPRAGRRPGARGCRRTTLEPRSSNSSGASGASASSRSITAGERVVVDDRRPRRRRPPARASRRRPPRRCRRRSAPVLARATGRVASGLSFMNRK